MHNPNREYFKLNFRSAFAQMRRDKSGAAAVEFALLLPLLVMGLVGIFSIGMYFYERDQIRETIRLASRNVIVEEAYTKTTIQNIFTSAMTSSPIDPADVNITILKTADGDLAQVRVPWSVEIRIPMIDPWTIDELFEVDIPLPNEA